MKVYLVLLASLLCVVLAKDYSGYQVLRITPDTDEDRQWLRSIEITVGNGVDFWSDVKTIPGSTVDIMVPPSLLAKFRKMFSDRNLYFETMISDVGETINAQLQENLEKRASTQALNFDFSVYHDYTEIQQWVNDIIAEYPDLTERFELPYLSYEGRTISGIKITGTGTSGTPAGMRKGVWFEGGIHAREWISPATVMYVTSSLLQNYTAGETDVMRLFDNLDFYIVPSLNADGYAYTWTEDRLWRKTRSSNLEDTGSGCMGADPNRNWPYQWGGEGTSAFPCSNVYHGIAPLSEQEVQGVVDFLRGKKSAGQDFIWFIDWHSYSQLIISPWSYTATVPDPDDIDTLTAAGDAMADAMYSFSGMNYTVGATARILYAAAGASNDYGYGAYSTKSNTEGGLGAKYSYVVELRDTGEYGFLLPEDQILGTGGESFHGVIAMGNNILDTEGYQ